MREGWIPVTLSPLWETLELMLSKFGIIKFDNPLWVHQNYFWNSLRQTSKFIWNEVDNWSNFSVSFSCRQWYICLLFMSQVCTMKLTESMNICYVSVRVSRTFDDDDDELLLWYGWPTKGIEPYFQQGPLSEILTIVNLRHAASRIWTCVEPEFRLKLNEVVQ